jgi:glutamyl-tRNA reductase
MIPVVAEPAHILFMRASSMHSADDYPVNQGPLWHDSMLALVCEPEVEATIASLKQHFESVRQHEVKRVRGRLGELSSTQETAIESLTHRIIDQILETPITVLKAASDDSESLAVIKAVHRVFSLSLEPIS